MQLGNKNSKLKDVQESLYDKNKTPEKSARRIIHDIDFNVSESWNSTQHDSIDGEQAQLPNQQETKPQTKFPIVILLISLIIFVAAGVFAGYKLSSGSGDVSKNLIALESTAPEFIDGGEPFDYVVSVSNQNTSKLELVDVEIAYFQGVDDTDSSRFVTKKSIGDVLPNALLKEVFPLTLYGVPGTIKKITTTLRYNVPGSTAIFEKVETKDVEIKSSSLAVSVETLKEVTPGQSVNVKVKVEATRGKTVSDATLKLTYPTGFEFISSDILPTKGNNIWDLGALAAGTVHEINISGIPRGEDAQLRNIRAQVGIKDKTGLNISALFAETSFEYVLTKAFLQTDILLAGKKLPTHIVSSGNETTITVEYKNNIDKNLQNAEVTLSLEGDAIMEETVRAAGGFYDSKTNMVTWTKSGVNDLAMIEPGAGGKLVVVFRTKNSDSLDANAEIKLVASSKARRISENQISESVIASQSTILKVVTQIALVAETARKSIFTVSGPIPPKKEQETTYVIISTIKNSVNPVEKAEVTFKLPQNVRFIEVNASQGVATYSDFDREVTWKAGSLLRSGSQVDPILYVHVGLTPSITEVGTSSVIARGFLLTGLDTFTKKSLSANGPTSITTAFRKTDGFKIGDEIVNK